jgi:hypothetical protein
MPIATTSSSGVDSLRERIVLFSLERSGDMIAIGNLVTFGVFAALGFFLWRFLDASLATLLVLLLGAVIGWFIGVHTLLFSGFGFAVRMNWAIPACSLGMMAGLAGRRRGAFAS